VRLPRLRWWLLSAVLLATGAGAGTLWVHAERLSGAYQAEGRALVERGRHRSALGDFTLAILLTPDDHAPYLARAHAFQALRRPHEALRDLDAAIRLAPAHPELHMLRGLLLADPLREHGRAIADFDAAIRLRPDDALAYYRRGLAYVEVNNPHHALSDLGRALALRPDLADAYLERAALHGRMREHRLQAADLGAALRLRPGATHLYAQRARVYQALRDDTAAVADFDRALAADAGADVHFERGVSLLNLRRYRAALADFDRALRSRPASAAVFYHRAHAWAALGERARARLDFAMACELAPASGTEACFQAQQGLRPRY
jgi:tetratricopeptide (TPR) repeat protein